MSQQYTIGKVAPTPRGAYVATTTYNPLDIVTYNGSSYWVLQSCTGITPPNDTYYQLIASKGNAGANGTAATITAGSVTMLDYGSNPTVSNSGTPNSAVLNFGIPYSPVSDNSVSTSKISNGAVTTSKINNSAVTSDKLQNGSVSYAKLGSDVKSLESSTQEMIADTNYSGTFSSGDYVVYNPASTSPELFRFTDDKASGAWDSTKVSATNVGIELNNRVEKESIQNAGIIDATYTTIFDTASATTSIHSNKQYPWVQISSTEDQIAQNNFYRVTFDGVEYTMCADMWYADNRNGKSASLLGNATYWGDIDGYLYPINDVPFLVSGLMSDGNTNTEGVFLFTETAGTHTIKIERVSYDFNKIPPLLISGFPHLPVHMLNNGNSGYNAISVGENIMKHLRSTFAVGSENDISAQLGIAFGQLNNVSGEAGKAFGRGNTVSGSGAVGIGEYNTASGGYAVAIGRRNTSSENSSTALGYYNTASGGYATAGGAGSTASGGVSTAIGYGVVANHLCQTAIGCYNVADPSTANAGQRGNYIEIVGNGTGENARSNARTLDWDGNESLAGGLTLGKGTANEVSITAQQLQQLLALLN